MPFSTEYLNPQLVEHHLIVEYNNNGQKTTPSINLDKYLGNVDGRLQWGGNGFYESARNTSLSGHILRTELKQGNKWVPATVDLSSHFHVLSGKWKYSDADLQTKRMGLNGGGLGYLNGSTDHSPVHTGFMEYAKTRSLESKTSSFFQYRVSDGKTSLELKGSILRFGSNSFIDLDQHIGIVNGKLVWGGKGFFGACSMLPRLDGHILVVHFEEEELKLDLTRYLEIYQDEIRIRVESDEELSRLFSEAPWMKFKVVTEPDVSEVVDSLTFSEAFGRLEESSRTLVAEMTRELVHSGSQKIMQSVTEQVMSRNTQELIDEIRESLRGEIEDAFESTKKSVFASCDRIIETHVGQMNPGEMTRVVTSQCEETIEETIKETTASAIADFRERVTVLMEKEVVRATMKRAQTKAALLKIIEKGEY